MNHTQNEKTILQKYVNQIIRFQKLFILRKYHMFWLSYEFSSILCYAFCQKKWSFLANTAVNELQKASHQNNKQKNK